jgi:hypothetical protein
MAIQSLATIKPEYIPFNDGATGERRLCYWTTASPIPPFAQTTPIDWERAVHHKKMASIYDDALFQPWSVLTVEPAP